MKKIILLVTISLLTNLLIAQTLTRGSNFTGVLVPRVMASGTTSRMPVVFRATVSGLAPNTLYRYFVNLALNTDVGTTNSGAGNPLYLSTPTIRYTTSASLTNLGGYDSLITNGSGSYTGWFAVVNTGNSRFTNGNRVFPSIVLDSAGSKRGIVNSRFGMTDSIYVLAWSAFVGGGTLMRGNSNATAKNMVVLYEDSASAATGILGANPNGRPISIALVESLGITIASLYQSYTDTIAGVAGAWGAIVTNNLSGGITKIEQRSAVTGNVLNVYTSSTGIWGSTSTISKNFPTHLIVTSSVAPLPVELINFKAEIANNKTILTWTTASEINNKGFEVEKSIDGVNFETNGFVSGYGNSNKINKYSFMDATQSSAFYRLKQIDFDGKFEYSNIVKVSNDEILVDLTPNPFNDNLVISSPTMIENAEIIDVTGKVKLMEIVNSNKATINTSTLSNGIYFIRINNGQKVITKRIVKN